MNIAQQIKALHVEMVETIGSQTIKDYNAFIAECEQQANDIEQDWDNESTTYTFADESVLVTNNQFVFTYGSAR